MNIRIFAAIVILLQNTHNNLTERYSRNKKTKNIRQRRIQTVRGEVNVIGILNDIFPKNYYEGRAIAMLLSRKIHLKSFDPRTNSVMKKILSRF